MNSALSPGNRPCYKQKNRWIQLCHPETVHAINIRTDEFSFVTRKPSMLQTDEQMNSALSPGNRPCYKHKNRWIQLCHPETVHATNIRTDEFSFVTRKLSMLQTEEQMNSALSTGNRPCYKHKNRWIQLCQPETVHATNIRTDEFSFVTRKLSMLQTEEKILSALSTGNRPCFEHTCLYFLLFLISLGKTYFIDQLKQYKTRRLPVALFK